MALLHTKRTVFKKKKNTTRGGKYAGENDIKEASGE
jgi:hypothetical protein